jgi:UDP-N-acetylmuramate dehydrogenase
VFFSADDRKENRQLLAPYTTLGVGGSAAYFFEPRSKEDIARSVRSVAEIKWDMAALGAGSNVLINDEGELRTVFLYFGRRFSRVEALADVVVAESGLALPALIKFLCDNDLADLSSLAGIPGTCGGAVYMNAGTAAGAIGDKVEWVEFFDPAKMDFGVLRRGSLGFGYRESIFKDKGLIISRVAVKRENCSGKEAWEKACSAVRERVKTQPYGTKNAGCFFKNPPGGVSAGALIERAGLKGMRIGGAEVSALHANFLINTANARSADFIELIKLVREKVREASGVELQLEIRPIGFPEKTRKELCG